MERDRELRSFKEFFVNIVAPALVRFLYDETSFDYERREQELTQHVFESPTNPVLISILAELEDEGENFEVDLDTFDFDGEFDDLISQVGVQLGGGFHRLDSDGYFEWAVIELERFLVEAYELLTAPEEEEEVPSLADLSAEELSGLPKMATMESPSMN